MIKIDTSIFYQHRCLLVIKAYCLYVCNTLNVGEDMNELISHLIKRDPENLIKRDPENMRVKLRKT